MPLGSRRGAPSWCSSARIELAARDIAAEARHVVHVRTADGMPCWGRDPHVSACVFPAAIRSAKGAAKGAGRELVGQEPS